MRPVSDAFLRAVRGSHRMVARATVVSGFPTGVSPVGTEIEILDGDIQHDASAKIRATLDLTIPGEYWPSKPTDLVTPYGPEVFIERGIVVAGGRAEWVSQGYYRIESVEQDDANLGMVRLSGKDRMAGLIDARLVQPVQYPPGTTVTTLFESLVTEVYPDVVVDYDFDPDATAFPGNHLAEEDRYGFLAEVVKALGKTWYWDYRGHLVVQDPPDPGTPVWQVDSGEGGVLVAMGRERTREGVYNAVVATGETPGGDTPPVRAVARDRSPTSPTRWGGPFGKVPRFFSSPFITTTGQAGSAAKSLLSRTLGLPYVVNFDAVPNPALEALDAVEISLRGRRERHVLEKITVPLTADRALTASTKDLTDVDIEVAA